MATHTLQPAPHLAQELRGLDAARRQLRRRHDVAKAPVGDPAEPVLPVEHAGIDRPVPGDAEDPAKPGLLAGAPLRLRLLERSLLLDRRRRVAPLPEAAAASA